MGLFSAAITRAVGRRPTSGDEATVTATTNTATSTPSLEGERVLANQSHSHSSTSTSPLLEDNIPNYAAVENSRVSLGVRCLWCLDALEEEKSEGLEEQSAPTNEVVESISPNDFPSPMAPTVESSTSYPLLSPLAFAAASAYSSASSTTLSVASAAVGFVTEESPHTPIYEAPVPVFSPTGDQEPLIIPQHQHQHVSKQDRRQSVLLSAWCRRCGDYALRCALCQMAVRGAFYFCEKCGHGGHPEHLRSWFAVHTDCAAGCGCLCGQTALSLLGK